MRGLKRSETGAEQLRAVGAEVHYGDLRNLESLRSGATGVDAVVNLAFNHDDMSKFAESGQDERMAIEVMGSVLEPGKLLVVTSGTGLAAGGPGHVRLETDPALTTLPRNPETAARAVAERSVRVAIVRLPQVHDQADRNRLRIVAVSPPHPQASWSSRFRTNRHDARQGTTFRINLPAAGRDS